MKPADIQPDFEMTFADKVLEFYQSLLISERLPKGVVIMNPYVDQRCFEACRQFYQKFYGDQKKRHLILGINPGRYGAGITGIPFTDPIKLEEIFGIANTLPKKPELSAEFIHMMIAAFGGYDAFFSRFFINSVSPLGFMLEGKNLNYYDTPRLKTALTPFVKRSITAMLNLGTYRDAVFCLGEGENYKFLRQLNAKEQWFDEVIPLAHPRFIMQYRRKHLQQYIDDYLSKLGCAART